MSEPSLYQRVLQSIEDHENNGGDSPGRIYMSNETKWALAKSVNDSGHLQFSIKRDMSMMYGYRILEQEMDGFLVTGPREKEDL